MAAQDEGDVAGGKAAGGIWKSLLHECVVAQVGVGVGDDGEENDDREAEGVAEFDGEIESGIVVGALCSLHPVDDASRVLGGRAGAADGDSFFVRGEDGGERGHGGFKVSEFRG
jgi:hypothetical protein